MRSFAWIAPVLGALAVAGCGGGGGASSSPSPTPVESGFGTAKFVVDLEKGVATPTPIQNSAQGSRAIYSGSTVSFSATEVFSDPGEVTRKRVLLRMRNNSRETIGSGGKVRVVIENIIANNEPFLDLRLLSQTALAVGDGGTGTAEGPAFSTAIGTPSGVAYAGNNGFIGAANSRIRLIRNNYVSTLRASQVDPQAMVYLAHPTNGQEYGVYCEAGSHVVRSINLGTASLTTLAGAVGTAGDAVGAPGSARFNNPSGIAIESQSAAGGSLLVADRTNGKIKRITFNWTGGGPVASTVELKYSSINQPNGVAVSSQGWIAVAETGLARVRIYPGGGSNAVVLGTGGLPLPGLGNEVGLTSTYGVAYYGEQLVLTAGNKLAYAALRPGASPIIAQNWFVGLLAFDGVGYAEGAGDTAQASADLRHIAVSDGGQIALADAGNNRIRTVDASRAFLEIGRFGEEGVNPSGVRVANATGTIPELGFTSSTPYISFDTTVAPNQTVDLGNIDFAVPEGVTKFQFIVTLESEPSSPAVLDAVLNATTSLQGSPNVYIRTIARGTSLFDIFDGQVGNAAVGQTSIIAASSNGVYFDGVARTIRRYDDKKGVISTIAGSTLSIGTLDGIGSAASFTSISAITCSDDGTRIYVAQLNHCVRLVAYVGPEGGDMNASANWRVATIAGLPDTPGDEGGLGGDVRLTSPGALAAIPGTQSILIGQNLDRIGILEQIGEDPFNPSSYQFRKTALFTGSASITGIGIGKTGVTGVVTETAALERRLHVAEHSSGSFTPVTAIGSSSADSSDTTGVIANAKSVAVDSAGYVYVADFRALRRYNTLGLRTVVGSTGFANSDGRGNEATLGTLNGIAISPRGELYGATSQRLFKVQRIVD